MTQNLQHIKVIIVDDLPLFIVGIKMILEEQLKVNVIGTASNGQELLEHPLLQEAHLLLIDCEMPVMNGIEAAKQINFRYPDKKMIAITMYQDNVYLTDLIQSGFKGYVHKPEIVDTLESVIINVLNNQIDFKEDLKVI